MNEPSPQADIQLQIRKPCPKNWAELTGEGKQRFCSQCSLHVHDAAQLTRQEAQALVAQASARVCMRIEYDASGTPLYRDSSAEEPAPTRTRKTAAARLTRWALSAAAGLLAACHGSVSPPPSDDPGANGGESSNSKMGKVSSTLMGDVATPAIIERLGEVGAVPTPPIEPAPLAAAKPEDGAQQE